MTTQFDENGKLRHLLTFDGLPRQVIENLLVRAQSMTCLLYTSRCV